MGFVNPGDALQNVQGSICGKFECLPRILEAVTLLGDYSEQDSHLRQHSISAQEEASQRGSTEPRLFGWAKKSKVRTQRRERTEDTSPFGKVAE